MRVKQSEPKTCSHKPLFITSALLIAPSLLFQLSFLLKGFGVVFPLHTIYLFDQLLFDLGDFLILVGLPLIAFLVILIAIRLRKNGRRSLRILAIVIAIIFFANLAGYAILDRTYEARRQSIYEN